MPRPGADRRLRVVLAGLGFWGRTWIDVVRASPHWQLAAVVDADPAALARIAEGGGIPGEGCFGSVAEAAAAVELDAALVVVPPAGHAAVALEALEAGLHCLVEKPFAETLDAARAVVERADALGRVVMVSQQYRHRPGARTVQRLVREEAVGPTGAATIAFANVLPAAGFQRELDEPLLRDMAIHHFDLVRGILGVEPVRVTATGHNPPWSEYAGNAAATVVLETADGVAVSYAGTWAPRGATTGWDGIWEILGERGTLHWDGDEVRVRTLEPPLAAKVERRVLRREWRGRRIKAAPLEEADRGGVLAELAAAIREGREPETSARDNIRSLALTIAAVESVRRGAGVEVAEMLAGGW